MLSKNLLIPVTVESALSFASNYGSNTDLLCEWVPANKSWKNRSGHLEINQDGSKTLMDCNSQVITDESNGTRKRRRIRKRSLTISSVEQKAVELNIDTVKGSSSIKANLESGNGNEACMSYVESNDKVINSSTHDYDSINNEYTELLTANSEKNKDCAVTTATQFTSFVEPPIFELVLSGEDISARDLCILVLRSNGLLIEDQDWSMKNGHHIKIPEINEKGNNFQACKSCGYPDHTSSMLLCDNCEEAFHVSCCIPKTKLLPTDEWFCQPCSKLIGQVSRKNPFLKSPLNINGWNGNPRFKVDSISSMLSYSGPYTSRVRIGDAFQAAVPEWSGQASEDFDCIGESLEMDLAATMGLHGCSTDNYMKSNFISNWLQCQEVLYDDTRKYVAGIICRKWRR